MTDTDAIMEFIAGEPHTIKEIAEHFDYTIEATTDALLFLAGKGRIRCELDGDKPKRWVA